MVLAAYVICAIFAVEFAWRWRRSGLGKRFLPPYWHEIVELIRQDQATGRLRFVPSHDDIVRLVSDTIFRILHQGLAEQPREAVPATSTWRSSGRSSRSAPVGCELGHQPARRLSPWTRSRPPTDPPYCS